MNQSLCDIYQDLIQQYQVSTQGEIVTEFCDKGTVHSYIDFYDREFAPLRSQVNMLEIGLMTGASLLLWSRYFDQYTLTGVDLRAGWNQPRPWHTEIENNPEITVLFGIDSRLRPPRLNEPFDVILDDGAHDWQSQMQTFARYWPLLRPGGNYYIEDVESDISMATLKYNIAKHASDLRFDVHVGRKNGRIDDQILVVRKKP